MSAPETKSVGLRRWLAIGTGVGIEILNHDLRITVARVRPSGVQVLGVANIPHFDKRPASEWGAEYDNFLRKLGARHLAATVLLPREDVIVRPLTLPGVGDKDLGAAVQYQLDSLHPYADDEAVAGFARIGRTPHVLVGVAHRNLVDRYTTLFAEAGIKMAALTFSAPVLHAAIRLLTVPPAGLMALEQEREALEVYGESEAKPVYSALLEPFGRERALAQIRAELRLPADVEPQALSALLPAPVAAPAEYQVEGSALPYAAAVTNACPRLGLSVNLLPEGQRSTNARAMYIPTLVLAGILGVMLVLLGAQPRVEENRYREALQAQLNQYEPQARKVARIDKEINLARTRAHTLDSFKRRTQADLDALNEITRLIPPPGWVSGLELSRANVTLAAEAEQAAPLVKALDVSPLFYNSELTTGISRNGPNEVFRMRASREGLP